MKTVDLDVFYPHPPERVWQVLTDRRALAAWMMESNFEPKLGHKFQFRSQLLPGLETTIQCEVVELEEPSRLVYTWQESPRAEPSLVVWMLTAVAGGTQLQLKHHQFSYATTVATLEQIFHRRSGQFQPEQCFGGSRLQTQADYAAQFDRIRSRDVGRSSTLKLPQISIFNWEYWLNQTLPQAVHQAEEICR